MENNPRWLNLIIGWLIIIFIGLYLNGRCIRFIYPNGVPEDTTLIGIVSALFGLAIIVAVVWWGEKIDK